MARLYLPMTLTDLAAHHEAGRIEGVTPVVPDDEGDEAEELAMAQAAAESEALQGDFGRRVVVVAEADPDHPVLWRRVVAVHVDTEEVDFTADEVPDLGWFATQEVPALLESSRSV